MRILIIGSSESENLAKCHEAFRTGLRELFDVRLFGEGYSGYRSELRSFAEISKAASPDRQPDLSIVPYLGGSTNPFQYSGIADLPGPKAIVLDEYWPIAEDPARAAEFIDQIRSARIAYILSYFPQPLELFRDTGIEERFIHLPGCFDPSIFKDWGEEKRHDVGFLGAGTTDVREFYPERNAIHHKLLRKKGIRYLWAEHPGNGPHKRSHPLVGEGFSRAINSCRLFVTTGGRLKNGHAKYIEALASKTVLLAERPAGAERLKLQDGVNYVEITADNIEEKIDYYLARPELCERIAAQGYETALRYHSCQARAVDLTSALHDAAEQAEVRSRYKEEIRLHLGCGQQRLPGWLNVDMDRGADADLYLNFLELGKVVRPGTACEAMMIHSLNYLTLWEARDLFALMFRLFRPGGRLVIETADFENCYRKTTTSRENFAEYLEGVRPLHAFGSDHLEARQRYFPNAFSWTRWHLQRELELAGFTDIKTPTPETHHPWRDMRFEATKPATVLSSRAQKPPSILFLYDPQLGSSTAQVRGFIHQEKFRQHGWKAEYLNVREWQEPQLVAAAQDADIVYLLRTNSLSLVRAIKKHTRAKLVFDLTDALWKPYHRVHGWNDLEAILSECDAIFSENEFVCSYGRQFKPVYSIPAVLHTEAFAKLKSEVAPRNDGLIRVGWIGSTGTMTAILSIKDQLRALSKRYPMMELRLVGCADPKLVEQLEGVRVSVRPSYDERSMLEEILQMDIGIYPPPIDVEDYAIRGAQKAMLYMQGGIPAVAWNAGDCATVIEDGVTGMLVNMPDEWMSKIEKLIVSPPLRRKIGERAAASISEGHTHAQVFAILEEACRKVMAL